MRSKKRIILADGSRLLREMLRYAINKTDHLEVVRQVTDSQELSEAIETLDPAWVIVSLPFSDHFQRWIHEHAFVRFLFISPNENYVKLKWQTSYEENYADLSLKDFIHILEKDLQHT